jgi:hypothetical protein
VFTPRASSVSVLSVVTGEGVSVSVRRRIEPVTTMVAPSSTQAASFGFAVQSTSAA